MGATKYFQLLCLTYFSSLVCGTGHCKYASFSVDTVIKVTEKDQQPKEVFVTGCIGKTGVSTRVSEIKMSKAHVPVLHKEAVSSLDNLEFLTFHDIGISRIEEGAFVNLSRLTWLDLSHNKLEEVRREIFGDLPLHFLFLDGNKISYIGDMAFAIKTLEHLVLHTNELESFSPEWFIADSQLEALFLYDNRIDYVPANAFKYLKNLKTVDISHNRITALHKDAFNGDLIIEKINLGCNRIKTLHDDLFKPLPAGLKLLQEQANRLTFLSKKTMESLKTQSLNIDANPWQCACYWDTIRWAKVKKIRLNERVHTNRSYPVCIYSESNSDTCSETVNEALLAEFPNQPYVSHCFIRHA